VKRSTLLAVGGAVAFTAAGSFGTAAVIAQSGPTKTVTIDLKNGEQGPPGPPGPQGPPGSFTCPQGFVEGTLIINHPGGQAKIFTCITEGSS
jgi:hypothetical protein